jgi:AcrR family transcriptional regulator
MSQETAPNRQVTRTKGWIFDALMALMEEKPYSKITVSDITKRAGIARQTFYRNYKDKIDVIFEYVMNTMNADLFKVEASQDAKKQRDIILSFNYEYMLKHKNTLKKILSTVDIENRILREVQELPLALSKPFKNQLSKEEYLICRYKICYQIAGCLRVFLDWFIHDMPFSANKFGSMLNAMTTPREVVYRNIPGIIVRIT